jgi:hypothetical protein
MKSILLSLIIISQGFCGELKLLTDSYVTDPVIPTISYKKTNAKFINLYEIENPYCSGTLEQDSILYIAIQKDKEEREFMKSLISTPSNNLTREQLDSIIMQAQTSSSAVYRPCGKKGLLDAPEPNTNSLLLIGLGSLLFARKNK